MGSVAKLSCMTMEFEFRGISLLLGKATVCKIFNSDLTPFTKTLSNADTKFTTQGKVRPFCRDSEESTNK